MLHAGKRLHAGAAGGRWRLFPIFRIYLFSGTLNILKTAGA
jgi:hypothetical protein